MSYTPPQYVDTKSQAILALASVIADEDKTALGDGSVNRALDVLADVLAESDVQVPQTNAGAILALAQYASGMIKPEGTIAITENGEGIDVAQYATADVSVSGGGGATRTIQLLCVEVGQDDTVVGPSSQGITAPNVAHLDWETQQGTLVDIGEKSTVTVDEVTGVWKYEFDVTVGEIYSIGGETTWDTSEFGGYLNSDAQDPTVFNDVFTASGGLFTPINYSTTVIVDYTNII